MAKNGRSIPDLFGGYTHYDEHGKKIGESVPDLFGGYTEYDDKGRKIGHTDPDLLGGYTHYDSHGKKTGKSIPDMFGGYTNYDTKGKRTGSSDRGVLGGFVQRGGNSSINRGYVPRDSGSQNKSSSSPGASIGSSDAACYIATCVYGSYDCPEVWTLRRFRDEWLAKRRAGRLFIKLYYRYSPGLVRRKGSDSRFRSFWRKVLDRFSSFLLRKGYSNTPYKDRK